jgi:hypothetical protein
VEFHGNFTAVQTSEKKSLVPWHRSGADPLKAWDPMFLRVHRNKHQEGAIVLENHTRNDTFLRNK